MNKELVLERYNRWKNADLPEDLRVQLEELDEKGIEDSFYTDLEFGTAGIRGVLGPGTNRLNIFQIRKITKAYGKYLLQKSGKSRSEGVVISHDNRLYSRDFTLEASKMLSSMGIKTYVFPSLRPTPELSFAVRRLKASGGIMITASHNPKEYNGYKIYDNEGCQLTPMKVAPIVDIIHSMGDMLDTTFDHYYPEGPVINISKQIDFEYIQSVKNILLNKNLDKRDFKIVFTPQHGTSYELAKVLFKDLGYKNVTYVTEQCDPDPLFRGTKSPNPELIEAYDLALEYAKKVDADIIMTTDPDADRCGIMVKTQKGDYRLFTGNQTGALLIDYVFSQRRKLGLLHTNGVMFNSVVTSSFGAKIAQAYNISVESFLTGFKWIGDRIRHYEKTSQNSKVFEFGYEESYGYLLAPFARDKDSLQALTMIAEMANYYKQERRTLDMVYEDLQKKYGYHSDKLFSIYFPGADGKVKMDQMMIDLVKNPIKEILGVELDYVDDYQNQAKYDKYGKFMGYLNLPLTNMIKFFFKDGTTIAIRPSGTEPKAKFYYDCSGKDEETVLAKPDLLHKEVLKIVGLE